ncbi:MAG: RNA-binding transcriptional accessory protein [Bacteroidetes bacterium]|nr:MAG: RNA-binding transcriptional accessory protein [Bacteroidota bacterium]
MKEQWAIKIAKELNLDHVAVEHTLQLLSGGATIPFIARYRKEHTRGLDEVAIANIRDAQKRYAELEKRREVVLKSIEEQSLLTPLLEEKIREVTDLSALEDLYLPFKPKRKTRASIAREKGLEPLAKMIMAQNIPDFEFKAERLIGRKGVEDLDDAIYGALDIIAEWISERAYVRASLRRLFQSQADIVAKKSTSAKDETATYKNYYDWKEKAHRSPSHRILAMFRGEREGVLKIKLRPEADKAQEIILRGVLKHPSVTEDLIHKAAQDSYKRLIAPSLETELRKELKEQADRKAIRVFGENLRQLLLAPPLGQKRILAIDPGFRSGCKLVCLDEQGQLLHNETIYPHPPQREQTQSIKKISSLVSTYKIEAIAIGNGTAGRETEALIRRIQFDRKLQALMVNENGASIYSASKLARDEFPEYDVTVRGAISIGRRLMDPLAELVKIEPKAIGVGQYQHDVEQKALQSALIDVVSSAVNQVGVELNTASKELLQYVSGLGPVLAENIIKYRNENGAFRNRNELKNIARFGAKVFEQAAGFIRIADSENPLDNTAVHPESYAIVKRIAKQCSLRVDELIGNKEVIKSINIQDFADDKIGAFTLKDILSELSKDGRDSRKKFDFFEFDSKVHKVEDLHEGMILPGIITNITAFGAFVDVGVHQDGLVHISEMANRFISDPNDVVKLNQKVMIKVLSIDLQRKRLQFSIKQVED